MVRIVIILRPHPGKKATALQELAQPYPLTYFHIFKLKKKIKFRIVTQDRNVIFEVDISLNYEAFQVLAIKTS